jgi:four helix bundle protein
MGSMGAVRTHHDLFAWQEAMTLVELIYRRTAAFPKEEVYGLAAQMRRSAVSVPSNIAEGAGRNSPREFVHYLGIASGSLAELDTQLNLSARLGLAGPQPECVYQVSRVGMLLIGLRNSLRERAA